MQLSAFLILILLIGCSTDRDKIQFVTFTYDLTKKTDSIEFQNWKVKNVGDKKSKNYECIDSLKIDNWTWGRCFYEDDTYKVIGGCRGEFGGSIIFIDKNNTKKAYYLTCTCPSMVEKREDGFYITETLAHMTGHGQIIKIGDPKEQLITVDVDSLSTPWKEKRFKGIDRHEIYKKLSAQGQTLIDTLDYTFTLFFQFKGITFLIYSDYNTTYLGEVINSEINILDTLVNVGSWGYTDIPSEIVESVYHNRFERKYGTGALHKYSSGDVYVKQDTIIIGYIYKEWPRIEENTVLKSAEEVKTSGTYKMGGNADSFTGTINIERRENHMFYSWTLVSKDGNLIAGKSEILNFKQIPKSLDKFDFTKIHALKRIQEYKIQDKKVIVDISTH